MAIAADGKVVVPDYYDFDDDSSGSDRGGFNPGQVNPLNVGQSMPPGMEHTTFGDLTGSSRPEPPKERAPQPLQTFPPGSTDVQFRDNIIELFVNNTLSLLSIQNLTLNAPIMYANYIQSSLGRTHPVTLDNFTSNLQDYLNHKGGRKKQKRSVSHSVRHSVRHSIKKRRKSMSKKRKNGRKSNKKQR